jgi:NADPH:quinone reductase
MPAQHEPTWAVRIHEPGGPEALVWEEVPAGRIGATDVLIRHTAIGLNFIDIYQRRGQYKTDLPFIPGSEAAGVVVDIGTDVAGFRAGDRVAYADAIGAYCQTRVIPAAKLVRLPDSIDDRTAAAIMLKGLTAEYLLRRAYRVAAGQWVLIHAAAGGVGLLAGQWARALGATVVGTVGSAAKVALAKQNGYHHVINYRTHDFVDEVRTITDGRGVDVVYDSIGADTFPQSLDVLRRRGMWVPFGQSSGHIANFSPQMLGQRGSLFMTRPRLSDYVADPAEYERATEALFRAVRAGDVKVSVNQTFPLSRAADAHAALEGRATTGSTILTTQ